MTEPSDRSVSLEKESFSRRRLVDAARLLPVLSFILLAIPGYFVVTAKALLFIFTVWALLILLAAALARSLSRSGVDGSVADLDSPGPV